MDPRFTCPVCKFDRLQEPPKDFTICPCCGVEFDYDDVRRTVETLRAEWIAGGRKWWSKKTPAPPDWKPSI